MRSSTDIRVDPALAEPVWSQIEDGVRRLIATGTLTPGVVVPSVRELARELRVNPATVSKAYQHLVAQGILEVRRGDGTFVSDTPPILRRSERDRLIKEAASRYAGQGLTLGVTQDEAVGELASAWSDMAGGRGRSA